MSGALLLLSVILPLFTYSLSLASFGLLHVISEVNYVGLRFGNRLKQNLVFILLSLLFLIVVIRIALLSRLISVPVGHRFEIAIVFLLALAALITVKNQPWPRFIGFIITALLLGGLLLSPAYTLLILAILHNWTPVGFIFEATTGIERINAMILCFIIFLAVPVLIATGIPYAFLHQFHLVSLETTVLPTGPLAQNLSAYLPAIFHSQTFAVHAFSAIVFAQCMHYFTVIYLLPTFLVKKDKKSPVIYGIIVCLCFLLFLGFLMDFKMARSIYGIAAAVHAWLEIPILMIGFALLHQPKPEANTEGCTIRDERYQQPLPNS